MFSLFKIKKFTLQELIVVIAVLAILVMIAMPNVTDITSAATKSAVVSNVRNLQTAVEKFSNENNGAYPTVNPPTSGNPQLIDLDKLNIKYIKNLPKVKGVKYWITKDKTVWGATIEPPKVTESNPSPCSLNWTESEGTKSTNLYKVDGATIYPYKESVSAPYTCSVGESFYVSAVDKFGFETPPVGKDYVPSATESQKQTLNVGDYVMFGTYTNPDTGEVTDLKWLIVNKNANGYMLFQVSTDTLISFATDNEVWQESNARTYLNGEFYNNTFSSEQKNLINEVSHKVYLPEKKKDLATEGTNPVDFYNYIPSFENAYSANVTDKLYLPSLEETIQYITPYYSPAVGNKFNDLIEEKNSNVMNNLVIKMSVATTTFNDQDYLDPDSRFPMGARYENEYDSLYGRWVGRGDVHPIFYLKDSATTLVGAGSLENPWNFNSSPYLPKKERISIPDALLINDGDFDNTLTLKKTINFNVPSGKFGLLTFNMDRKNGVVSILVDGKQMFFNDPSDPKSFSQIREYPQCYPTGNHDESDTGVVFDYLLPYLPDGYHSNFRYLNQVDEGSHTISIYVKKHDVDNHLKLSNFGLEVFDYKANMYSRIISIDPTSQIKTVDGYTGYVTTEPYNDLSAYVSDTSNTYAWKESIKAPFYIPQHFTGYFNFDVSQLTDLNNNGKKYRFKIDGTTIFANDTVLTSHQDFDSSNNVLKIPITQGQHILTVELQDFENNSFNVPNSYIMMQKEAF